MNCLNYTADPKGKQYGFKTFSDTLLEYLEGETERYPSSPHMETIRRFREKKKAAATERRQRYFFTADEISEIGNSREDPKFTMPVGETIE